MELSNKEFEEFLKQQVDTYKMYPSEEVWHNVSQHLRSKQKLTIATILTLFILAILLSVVPQNEKRITDKLPTYPITFSTTTTSADIFSTKLVDNSNTVSIITNKANGSKDRQIALFGNGMATPNNTITKSNKIPSGNNQSTNNDNLQPLGNSANGSFSYNTNESSIAPEDAVTIPEAELLITSVEKQNVHLATPIATPVPQPIAGNNFALPTTSTSSEKTVKSRWQYYFVPSISYRTLADERNYDAPTVIPNAPAAPGSLEKAILHKPALGLEIGASKIMPLSRSFEFKIGAQINFNQYDIKATESRPEIATIALSNGSTQINNVTSLRNAEGSSPRWVNNNNLQISIPVGLNVIVAGTNRVQIGFSATAQPTYLIKNKMLLLSTDLKNYTEAPGLIRKFNVNGGLETFVAFSSKKLKVQIGPQIRYQLLSSYNKKYPFKENLFDYGFKVGFSKPF